MHKEAREEFRVCLKLVVLDLAHHLGVTKACRVYNVPRSSFYRWKQKYEKAPSPIAIIAGHCLKWWRRSWRSERSINLEPYALCIIWTATTRSKSPYPR